MGILLFVLRRGWSFIALSIVILVLVFLINYDPVITLYPQLQSILQPIRGAINRCIPIIAAIVVGIFTQGIALIYRLFESAIEKHLKELNEVAKALYDKIKEIKMPAYFSASTRVLGGYQLYMHIEAPLCDRYKDIVQDYGDLVEDIGNHWNKAGKALDEVYELCNEIDQHNKNVKNLERKLEECISALIKNDVIPRLPGADPALLKNFINFMLLSEVVPKIVRQRKKFKEIDRNYVANLYKSHNPSLEYRDGNLWVDGHNVGRITPNDWKKHEDLIIEIIYKVLRKYNEQLDRCVDEGQRLIERSKNILSELKVNLEYVAKARFLPLAKLCKYLM